MVETLLNLSSINFSLNSAVDLYKNVSCVFKGYQKQQYLEHIADDMERLSDNILYAPNMQVVQDVTKSRQQQIADLKEVRACLEPIQQVLGDEILSSAMILTPDKMQSTFAKNPWEVLIDARPIHLATPPNHPDLLPLVFHYDGMPFIGWQMWETLPILFDCRFSGLSVPLTGKEFECEVVTVDAEGEITNHRPHKAVQRIEQVKKVSLDRVYIPGGTFTMGSPEGEGSDREKPQHQVTVQPFYMGKYPVTQAQWQAVMGKNPSRFKRTWFRRNKNHPVEQVSWYDAVAFCQQLSALTGQTYRLPSEAEWEYACRAATTTPFCFGETITSDLANSGFSRKKTTKVGKFPPNAFALYDMHGNVWEWCADKWHANYKDAPTDGSVWETDGKNDRVLRGGSWHTKPAFSNAAYRNWGTPDFRSYSIGFRVVGSVYSQNTLCLIENNNDNNL